MKNGSINIYYYYLTIIPPGQKVSILFVFCAPAANCFVEFFGLSHVTVELEIVGNCYKKGG